MTTAAGRDTVGYIVRCALHPGTSITKQDQNGVSYTFQGALGFAPQWATGECDTACQEYISACLMAHVNTAGIHVPLYVVSQGLLGAPQGQPTSAGWGLSADYPNQEGSFFGNLFILGGHGYDSTSVAAFYCDGKAYDVATVPGRIGANQVGAPTRTRTSPAPTPRARPATARTSARRPTTPTATAATRLAAAGTTSSPPIASRPPVAPSPSRRRR